MEAGVLETVGKVAGIGGIALGVLLLVFREVVLKEVFPRLSRNDAFRLLRLITVLTFTVALAGVGAWVWAQTLPEPVGTSPAIGAGRDVTAGGDISVQGRTGSESPAVEAGQDVKAGGDIKVGQ